MFFKNKQKNSSFTNWNECFQLETGSTLVKRTEIAVVFKTPLDCVRLRCAKSSIASVAYVCHRRCSSIRRCTCRRRWRDRTARRWRTNTPSGTAARRSRGDKLDKFKTQTVCLKNMCTSGETCIQQTRYRPSGGFKSARVTSAEAKTELPSPRRSCFRVKSYLLFKVLSSGTVWNIVKGQVWYHKRSRVTS